MVDKLSVIHTVSCKIKGLFTHNHREKNYLYRFTLSMSSKTSSTVLDWVVAKNLSKPLSGVRLETRSNTLKSLRFLVSKGRWNSPYPLVTFRIRWRKWDRYNKEEVVIMSFEVYIRISFPHPQKEVYIYVGLHQLLVHLDILR